VSTLDPETIAEFAADLAKSDPEVARVIADVQKLDHLREDPGWMILKRRIAEQKERFLLSIARGLMAGKTPNPLEVAYRRGYFQGSKETVDAPEKAAISLERAARAAWINAQVEEAEGSEEPYI
jgi:hypothetical protein